MIFKVQPQHLSGGNSVKFAELQVSRQLNQGSSEYESQCQPLKCDV
jgi:hypothetical protein